MSETNIGHESNQVDLVAIYLERIAYKQSDLNVAAITLTGNELKEFVSEIIYELEAVCPYEQGQEVCMSGTALMPNISTDEVEGMDGDEPEFFFNVAVIEKDDEKETLYGRVEGIIGEYQGCVVQTHEGPYGKEYRIRHAATVGQASGIRGRGTRITNDTLVGFFEIGCTIQPIDEIEQSLKPKPTQDDIDSEQIAQIIDGYSIEVVRLMSSRIFRRMPLEQQQSVLRGLIKAAETESQVQDRYVRIDFTEPNADDPPVSMAQKDRPIKPTRHIYIPQGAPEKPVIIRHGKIPITLGGICVGLESLEWPRLEVRPLRKPRDLTAKRAGLCLAIDPDLPTSQAVGVNADQLIYVPVSSQRFESSFAD
jgi:hypothetical protein